MRVSRSRGRLWLGILIPVAALLVARDGPTTTNKVPAEITPAGPAVLWRDPVDIRTRDLYYGAGGKLHEPQGPYKFLNEDTQASSPKFEIEGGGGVKWKAKLGVEVRPEIAASRLLWAVGYFANEDYFVPELPVENMPHLQRGNRWVHNGVARDVRLKRHAGDERKLGTWSWRQSPFTGTREWYGLRVLMAVMNNWDLKDVNNSIYQVTGPNPEQHYLVSDLGASFGTTGLNRDAKGSLAEYRKSKWLIGVTGGLVDFNVPSAPGANWIFDVPEMTHRLGLEWIGRRIPVEHARWVGSLLARLSPDQLRDAFRAGGYSPAESEEFCQLVTERIRELNSL